MAALLLWPRYCIRLPESANVCLCVFDDIMKLAVTSCSCVLICTVWPANWPPPSSGCAAHLCLRTAIALPVRKRASSNQDISVHQLDMMCVASRVTNIARKVLQSPPAFLLAFKQVVTFSSALMRSGIADQGQPDKPYDGGGAGCMSISRRHRET